MSADLTLQTPEISTVAADPTPAAPYLSLILKVTERCNLACPYCYFFFGGDESYKQHPPFMDETTLESVVAFILDARSKHGFRHVRLGIHGGEPLLMKKDRFSAMCRRFREALGDEPTLTLCIQTNGVLVDTGWVDIFSEFQVRVGVSIDGPAHIHDRNRVTKRGAGSYAATEKGWQLMQQAHQTGCMPPPSILCVVSPKEDGGAIFMHFAQVMKAGAVNFLLPDSTHDALPFSPGVVDDCARFLTEVSRAWASGGVGGVRVRVLDEIIGPLLNDELYRRSAQRPSPLNQVCVSSNGDLCPDDVIRTYAPHFADTGLNIREHRFSDVAAHPAWRALADATLPQQCAQCNWRDICGGGMLQHRFSKRKQFDNVSIYCSALMAVHNRMAAQLIKGGFPVAELEGRLTRFLGRPV
jgi:uncharacterized protein